ATCIKGHRSTTCNHGERPLHEIKKKGRPSTQCPHCKELRKARQVHVRCICGKEEGASAIANGLKRAKSLSHDGRFSLPAAVSGEDLLRSLSQGQGPADASDAASPSGGVVNCGCIDGMVCTCCRDRRGQVVVKPRKGPVQSGNTPKNPQANRQRSTASLDLGKPGMILFPRDSASNLPFPPHANGGQFVQGPDGQFLHGLNGSGASPLFVQTLSPSASSGCEQSPSLSLNGQQGQMQPHLCFDYASSSDYDSDHYQPTSSYSYFPNTLSSYAVSNASDDLDEMDVTDSRKLMDGIMNGTTTLNPMEGASADEIRMLYSALSSFSTASPPPASTPPSRSVSSPGPIVSGPMTTAQLMPAISAPMNPSFVAIKNSAIESIVSPASSIASYSASAGRSENGDEDRGGFYGAGRESNSAATRSDLDKTNNAVIMNDMSLFGRNGNINVANGQYGTEDDGTNGNSGNLTTSALNLSAALNLIQSNNQLLNGAIGLEIRQELADQVRELGHTGVDPSKMQHPTVLSDNGVLICGCGCGRPTVDCAECFRDMCQFVGESQARMLKEDLALEAALGRNVRDNGSELGGSGMNMNHMNMNMAMNANFGLNSNIGLGMDMNMANLNGPAYGQAQTMSLLSMQNGAGRDAGTPLSYEQQQQQQQRLPHPQAFVQVSHGVADQDALIKKHQQLLQQQQLRMNLRRQFRESIDEEQQLQLQLMEQEQMQLQQQ
ncbi:hypothetical protein BGW38_003791, partial [Lunasporangiospora selenospora]